MNRCQMIRIFIRISGATCKFYIDNNVKIYYNKDS